MMTIQRMLAVATLTLFLVIPSTAKAQYTFTTIDVPGSVSTAANGNSPSAIVGEYVNPGSVTLGGVSNPTHGYLLTKDGFTTIDVPGAWYTTCNGVNANGDIVGIYRDDLDNPLRRHGFIGRRNRSRLHRDSNSRRWSRSTTAATRTNQV
jgi:hypothetical protein